MRIFSGLGRPRVHATSNATYTVVTFVLDRTAGVIGAGDGAAPCGAIEPTVCIHLVEASRRDAGRSERCRSIPTPAALAPRGPFA